MRRGGFLHFVPASGALFTGVFNDSIKRWFSYFACVAAALLSAGGKVQRSLLQVTVIDELHMMRRVLGHSSRSNHSISRSLLRNIKVEIN